MAVNQNNQDELDSSAISASALIDENQTVHQNASSAHTAQPNAATGQQYAYQGIEAITRVFQTDGVNSSADPYFETLREIMKRRELIAKYPEMKSVELSARQYSLSRSVFALGQQVGDVLVTFAIIIDTGGKIRPTLDLEGEKLGRKSYIDSSPSMVYDNQLKSQISAAFSAKNCRHIGRAVILHTVAPTDINIIGAIVENALIAISDNVALQSNTPKSFTVSSLVKGNTAFAQVISNPLETIQGCGLPLRSDIQMILSYQAENQQRNQYNVLQGVFGKIDCYADVSYMESSQQQQQPQMVNINGQMMQIYQPATPATQKFVPSIIINSISTGSLRPSLELNAIALSFVFKYRNNKRWYQAFMPKNTIGMPLRSLKGLMYDYNADQDVNSVTFDDASAKEMLDNSVQDKLVIREKLSGLSTQEYLDRHFINAAVAKPDQGDRQARSQNVIRQAWDRATNGAFSKFYPTGNIIHSNIEVRFEGYYKDEAGVHRDIAELENNLAVSNYFGGGAAGLEKRTSFERTFVADTTATTFEKLNQRKAILIEMVGENNLFIEDYSSVITYVDQALLGLEQAVTEQQLIPREDNVQYVDNAPQRGYNFVTQTAMGMTTGVQYAQQQVILPQRPIYQ